MLFGLAEMMVLSVFGLIIPALVVIPFWKLFERVGHPGWYAIGIVVPFLNIVMVYYLAFAEWPRERNAAPGP